MMPLLDGPRGERFWTGGKGVWYDRSLVPCGEELGYEASRKQPVGPPA